jgi:hypothetical protein
MFQKMTMMTMMKCLPKKLMKKSESTNTLKMKGSDEQTHTMILWHIMG